MSSGEGKGDPGNMKTRIKVFTLCTMLFALCVSAEAQQTQKFSRIGELGASSPSANPARYEAFRQRLRELGYVEGKNIAIEGRYAEGQLDRLPDLAAELVRLNVDVIVARRAYDSAVRAVPGRYSDKVRRGECQVSNDERMGTAKRT